MRSNRSAVLPPNPQLPLPIIAHSEIKFCARRTREGNRLIAPKRRARLSNSIGMAYCGIIARRVRNVRAIQCVRARQVCEKCIRVATSRLIDRRLRASNRMYIRRRIQFPW